MIRGETVVVKRRVRVGTGPGNTPLYEDEETPVEDVLVAPGPRTDVDGPIRPDGVEVTFNLHFPKTFTGSLRGAEIVVRGDSFDVIGDPRPYTLANTPTRWNMPVEVTNVQG